MAAVEAALVTLSERHFADPSWVWLWVSLKLRAAADPDHMAHSYLVQRLEVCTAELASELSEAQRHGRVRSVVDCRAAAVGVLALHEGLLVQALAGGTADVHGPLRWTFRQLRA